MPIRTRTAIAAVAVATVALVAGCSSSKDGASSTTTVASASSATTTKAEFITAASSTCSTMNAKMAAAGAGENYDSLAAAIPGLQAQSDLLDQTITEIKALPQPTGADSPTELYSSIAAVQSTLQQLVTAAKANDTAQAAQLSNQLNTQTDAANKVWDAYGLTTCGSDTSTKNQNQNNQNQNQNNQQQQNQNNQNDQQQNQNQNDQQQNQ